MLLEKAVRRSDVYCSGNLHIRAEIRDPSRFACVHFAGSGRPRESGSRLGDRQGLNLISVTATGDDWYQYADVPLAQAALRGLLAAFPRTVLFGSSMGGYGALHWSAALGADAVLAFSPQAHINPARPPHDLRWAEASRRIESEQGFPFDDLAHNLSRSAEVVVGYDSGDADQAHIAAIEACRPIKRLVVPLTGHGTVAEVARLGLVSCLLHQLGEGAVDIAAVRTELRSRMQVNRRLYLLFCRRESVREKMPRVLLRRLAHAASLNAWPDQVRVMRACLGAGLIPEAYALAQRAVEDDVYLRSAAFPQDMARLAPHLVQHREAAPFAQRLQAQAQSGEQPDLEGPMATALEETARALGQDRGAARRRAFALLLSHSRLRHANLLMAAAEMFAAAGDPDAAAEAAIEAQGLLNAWDSQNLPLARILYRLGRPAEGAEAARRVLAQQPDSFDAYALLAGAPEAAGDWDAATAIWATAVQAGADPPRSAHRLARGLVQQRRFAAALAALDPAVADHPANAGLLRLQAQCLQRLGQPDRAAVALRALIALVPEDAAAWHGLGEVLALLGQEAAALAAAREAERLKPDQPRHAALVRRLADAAPG